MASMTGSTRKAAPKYECALCGRRSRAEQMVYSTHTHQRYCGTNVAECHARRRRLRAKAARS